MLFVLKLLFYFVLFICKNKAFYLKNATQTLKNRTLTSFLLRIVHIIQEKQPVLAIETDGYSYHNDETEQHQRDMMKDHILSNYGLPLLRLSTKGSGEREKIISSLNMVVCWVITNGFNVFSESTHIDGH